MEMKVFFFFNFDVVCWKFYLNATKGVVLSESSNKVPLRLVFKPIAISQSMLFERHKRVVFSESSNKVPLRLVFKPIAISQSILQPSN